MTDPNIEQTLETGQTPEFQLDPAPQLDAAAPAEAIPTTPVGNTFTLPSGTVVAMKDGKGRDLLAAQRAAGTDSHQVTYALAAVLCTFDGQRRVMEDILDMPLGDVMKLMAMIGDQAGGDFLPSTPAASSTSRP